MQRGRVPKVLYVVCSTPSNPHANGPVEVFTSRQKAERARRWSDQRLIEFVPRAVEAASQSAPAVQVLLDAAVCFGFGEWRVEHIVDTDGKDWGWVVSKNGIWAQEGMTRDEAIEEAMDRAMSESRARPQASSEKA
jgi:hypothetical protein